ncbi:LarC family nickel insertion protein [Algibacillus agarilyticus]|uniref:LarC family nickel insertion protein n=1 Tax=Algibacillus agarilyticus TaxID=2234133 RepID=UPI000DD008EF|nr:LarC family nickel insertion protein [Algibacillus agarilyticus]
MLKLNPKKHIHLDVVGGIAGDMFVGAMLDAFPRLETIVLDKLKAIMPADAGDVKTWFTVNGGMCIKRFALMNDVVASEIDLAKSSGSEAQPVHKHQHEHSYTQEHTHQHESAHIKTTCKYLLSLIAKSELSEDEKDIACDLLTILATAEAKVHNTTLDRVHFHELADWDSLMDIVAAAIIFSQLAEVSWSVSTLPMGRGFVKTQHGLLPVPAPATSELLQGFSFRDDGIEGERITPTGAAILRYLKPQLTPVEQSVLLTSGYGGGNRTLNGLPNMLRAMVYEYAKEEEAQEIAIIHFDIDDMTGEEVALALDKLRATTGVLDVNVFSARGKKGRHVEQVQIQACLSLHKQVIDQCFIETSTTGLRWRFEQRRCLERTSNTDNIVTVKKVQRPDATTTLKIEHDELIKYDSLARRRAVKALAEQNSPAAQLTRIVR